MTDPSRDEVVSRSSRVSRDRMFSSIAYVFGQRSTCPRAQVGAIVTREGRIVSSGYNGAPSGAAHCFDVGCGPSPDQGCTRAVHAEANAIAWAARSGLKLEGTTMYCTHESCLNCAKLIVNAGITTLIYSTAYRLHDGSDLLQELGVKVEQYPRKDADGGDPQ